MKYSVANGQRSLLTFHLGEFTFGIDLAHVAEVLTLDELRRVPGAPEVLKGLANFRGQIISIIELRNRFSLLPFENEEEGELIVVRIGEQHIGFAVDSVAGPVRVAEGDFEPLPKAISPRYQQLVEGVFKLQHQLLLMLNIDAAARLGEQSDATELHGPVEGTA